LYCTCYNNEHRCILVTRIKTSIVYNKSQTKKNLTEKQISNTKSYVIYSRTLVKVTEGKK